MSSSIFAPPVDGLPLRFDVRVHPAAALNGKLYAQPSKNFTTRYVLAAALAEGESLIEGVADSEDAHALFACLRAWGADLQPIAAEAALAGQTDLRIRGFGGKPRAGQRLDVGNAGTVARFLLAIASLTTDSTLTTGYPDSLGQRPQKELLDALQGLGANITSRDGQLPVRLSGGTLQGGSVSISAERSSQFASALMFLAPLLARGLDLSLTGHIKSHAPLRQTLQVLAAFGINYQATPDLRRITIAGQQSYQAGHFVVAGDYPAAAAILTAAALVKGEVSIGRLAEQDLQGEREALAVLQEMGAQISRRGDVVTVHGGQPLRAVVCDGDRFTDAVQVLTAAAAFAEGRTTWQNIATLRLKECDRISDTRRELERLGLQASETPSSLSISGQPQLQGGITVNGHGDHRMIMLLTLLGLRCSEPLYITEAQHIRKSYPLFFRHLEQLGARFDYLPKSKG